MHYIWRSYLYKKWNYISDDWMLIVDCLQQVSQQVDNMVTLEISISNMVQYSTVPPKEMYSVISYPHVVLYDCICYK